MRRPSVQAWPTCPSCGHWSALCARLCVFVWGQGACLHGNIGRGHAFALALVLLCVCAACVCAAFGATVSVPRVRRPLVQPWSTCPSCGHWSTLCAWLCVRGRRMTMSCIFAGVCCVCGLCSCSLGINDVGATGAAAIGAGLVHLLQLRTLKCVVCLGACVRGLVVCRRMAMYCVCVLVCVRAGFVQPLQQPYL